MRESGWDGGGGASGGRRLWKIPVAAQNPLLGSMEDEGFSIEKVKSLLRAD